LTPTAPTSGRFRSTFYSGPGENGTHGFSTLHNPFSSDRRILDNYYKNDVERRRPQPSGRNPLCLFSAGPHGTFTDVSCDHVVDASHRPVVTTGVAMHSIVCFFSLFHYLPLKVLCLVGLNYVPGWVTSARRTGCPNAVHLEANSRSPATIRPIQLRTASYAY
jgi:hypothetical protein